MTTRFELRLTEREKRDWQAKASAAGLTLAAWIKRQCSSDLPVPSAVAPPVQERNTKARRKQVCARCVRVNGGVPLPGCTSCK